MGNRSNVNQTIQAFSLQLAVYPTCISAFLSHCSHQCDMLIEIPSSTVWLIICLLIGWMVPKLVLMFVATYLIFTFTLAVLRNRKINTWELLLHPLHLFTLYCVLSLYILVLLRRKIVIGYLRDFEVYDNYSYWNLGIPFKKPAFHWNVTFFIGYQ